MRRGDIVTIAVQGDFGKPRPAVVIQGDAFNEAHATITVLPVSSALVKAPLFRIDIEPGDANGLVEPCQAQADKVMTVRREKAGPVIGRLDDASMLRINRALALWPGLA